MKLIGLNGRLHSGKDTAVRYIELVSGARVRRAAFADKMKLSGLLALGFRPETAAEALDLANRIKETGTIRVAWHPHDLLNENPVAFKTITGREYWQYIGTEAHRDVFGEDIWVDALLPQFSGALQFSFPDTDVLIVTDVRFPNEAERILNLNGVVWHIDADKRLGPLPANSHSSEHPLPPEYITVRVPNNATLDQFDAAIHAAYVLCFR